MHDDAPAQPVDEDNNVRDYRTQNTQDAETNTCHTFLHVPPPTNITTESHLTTINRVPIALQVRRLCD